MNELININFKTLPNLEVAEKTSVSLGIEYWTPAEAGGGKTLLCPWS